MAHTEGRYQQDLGFTDGHIFAGPGDVVFTGTAPTLTRIAPGYSLNFPNTSTSFIGVNLTQMILRRTGFFEDLQEQFGPANPSSPAATAIAGSAQVRNYRPDAIGAMNTGQQLQPRTAFKTKGIRLINTDVIYGIAGGALTTHTIRMDSVLYVNNVAAANTVILANAANGLATATQANPYVTTVAPTVQPYFIAPDGEVWIDVSIVTPAGGTYVFYGFDVNVEYNYN
jgi:hypothetical protein